jgi:hypothetical protein
VDQNDRLPIAAGLVEEAMAADDSRLLNNLH